MNLAQVTKTRIRTLEKVLNKAYAVAQSEIHAKWKAYMDKAGKEIAGLQDAYDAAKAAGDAQQTRQLGIRLANAKRMRTIMDERYQALLDDITTRLSDANAVAVAYANRDMAFFYALNYNTLEKVAARYGISFKLVNEDVVRRLATRGEVVLPKRRLSVPKDRRWNMKQINSSLLQGILQGESMDKIADRILPVVDNNRKSAIRAARTMVTGAECSGRIDGYRDLEERGLIQRKVWIATPDDRTRPSHIDIDGEEQEIDMPFSNGLMYPGDPNGDAAEVWNCRCTLGDHIIGFRRADGSISTVQGDHGRTLHHEQMDAERARREALGHGRAKEKDQHKD